MKITTTFFDRLSACTAHNYALSTTGVPLQTQQATLKQRNHTIIGSALTAAPKKRTVRIANSGEFWKAMNGANLAELTWLIRLNMKVITPFTCSQRPAAANNQRLNKAASAKTIKSTTAKSTLNNTNHMKRGKDQESGNSKVLKTIGNSKMGASKIDAKKEEIEEDQIEEHEESEMFDEAFKHESSSSSSFFDHIE